MDSHPEGPTLCVFGTGVAFSFATLCTVAYVLAAYFMNWTVSGWTSLALLILAFASVQFVLMGVIGEYIGRLYMEAKRRPLFVVRQVVAADPQSHRSETSAALPAGIVRLVATAGAT